MNINFKMIEFKPVLKLNQILNSLKNYQLFLCKNRLFQNDERNMRYF